MFINVREIGRGPGPKETVIEIDTRDGQEEVVVNRGLIRSGAIDIGAAIGREDGHALIELPRESTSGKWRVWVKSEQLKPAEAA